MNISVKSFCCLLKDYKNDPVFVVENVLAFKIRLKQLIAIIYASFPISVHSHKRFKSNNLEIYVGVRDESNIILLKFSIANNYSYFSYSLNRSSIPFP